MADWIFRMSPVFMNAGETARMPVFLDKASVVN